MTYIDDVKQFSHWWHSDKVKRILFPTFSWVYRHARFETTRRILDWLHDIYFWVDDTFWATGSVDLQEEIPAQALVPTRMSTEPLPMFNEVLHAAQDAPHAVSQGGTGECTCYTVDNHVKTDRLKAGLPPVDHAISPEALYARVAYQGKDQGAVFAQVVKHIARYGVPLDAGFKQDLAKGYFDRLKTTRKPIVDAQWKFTMPYATGNQEKVYGWENIKAKYEEAKHTHNMQINISILGNYNNYFGKHEVYRMSGKYLSGHSLAGFMLGRNRMGTSEGAYVIESAYRPTLLEKVGNKLVALRYIDRSVFDSGQAYALFYEKKNKIQSKARKHSKYDHLVTAPDMRIGSRGEYVQLLQEFLKEKGYLYINKTTDYFGNMTLNALRSFLRANGYYGKVKKFGNISRKTIKKSLLS